MDAPLDRCPRAGQRGLGQLLTLRPQIAELDRELITGMDTWVPAGSIETTSELDTLIRLGVPRGVDRGLVSDLFRS